MGFEDVSENLQWECRWIAEAFGVKQWECLRDRTHKPSCEGTNGRYTVKWFVASEASADIVVLDTPTQGFLAAHVRLRANYFDVYETNALPGQHELMGCGLYRLGLEDEELLAKLNHRLTAHEKLGLRLSMPREFWPKTWLNEESREVLKE